MPETRAEEAICKKRRNAASVRWLRAFVEKCNKDGQLDEWKRGRGILGYTEGKSLIKMAVELDVTRGFVNRWLQWYMRQDSRA